MMVKILVKMLDKHIERNANCRTNGEQARFQAYTNLKEAVLGGNMKRALTELGYVLTLNDRAQRLKHRVAIWWYYKRPAWRSKFRWLHPFGEWYGERLLRKHGLDGWRCRIEDLIPVDPWDGTPLVEILTYLLGECDFANHVIRIHAHCPFTQFRQVVLHEIAHALVGEVAPVHGQEFIKTATRIGVRPAHLGADVQGEVTAGVAVPKGEGV